MARLFSGHKGGFILIVLLFIPHMLFRVTLDPHFPTTHDLTGDWANHAHSVTWFLTGYVIAKSEAVWDILRRSRWLFLTLSMLLGAVLTVVWNDWDQIAAAETWLWPARTGRVLYYITVILALLAWAQQLITRDWPGRAYLTDAIFPYYILHQTLIVCAGFWLTRQSLGAWPEFALVMLATVGGCVIGYEVIRRVPLLQPLFGSKASQLQDQTSTQKNRRPSLAHRLP